MICTDSRAQRIPQRYKTEGVHSGRGQSVEFTDTNINDGMAVVVTKETGSAGQGTREGVTNLWFVADQGGEWKIVGSGHFIRE